MKDFSHRRLALIRELIGLAFLYGHDTELFYRRFIQAVGIRSLKEKQIIGIPEEVLENAEQLALREGRLSEAEIEMCSLEKCGFTDEELCILYGYKNKNSIYVKRCRINRKLNRKLEGYVDFETLLFGTLFLIVLCLAC
ncbi:MAG: hypothetical protein LBU80_03870 [Rikenellaceae bacterium]|jgi:hypothetical protein|nr:hypothetical protein [Rikenellaceae bacterium]